MKITSLPNKIRLISSYLNESQVAELGKVTVENVISVTEKRI